MTKDEALEFFTTAAKQFVESIKKITGVQIAGEVDMTYICGGVDFRLPITINGQDMDACQSIRPEGVIFWRSWCEDGEWENEYSPYDNVDGLAELIKAA